MDERYERYISKEIEMKNRMLFVLLMCFINFGYSYDLELMIGKDLIKSRIDVYKDSLKDLGQEMSNEEYSFVSKLQKQFKTYGGYNFMSYVTSLKIGWSQSIDDEWVAEITGDFKKEAIFFCFYALN